MNTQTIDSAMARRMVEVSAILGASIIGMPGGWLVMLKVGTTEKPLGTQRTDKPRVWRSLDTCMEYLKNDLHIIRDVVLDASNHSPGDVTHSKRVDASERMKRAHAAAAHDEWFRAEVEQALGEADDPATQWVSQEEADVSWAKQRAALAERAGKLAA
jgi:hypothetical protein